MTTTDVMERMPPIGWYPEGPDTTILRWWDGDGWTDHVHDTAQEAIATPAVEPEPEVAAFDDSAISEDIRERVAGGYTTHTETDLPGLSQSGLSKNDAGPASWWDTSRQPAPVRSSTESVWALAFTPWIAALSSVGAALVFTLISAQIGALVAGALVPMLWMLATAVQDRKSLVGLGFRTPASEWWILLGPLAYMIARTIRVVRVTGKGRAPLVLLLINTIAVPVAVFAAVQFLPGIMGQF